MHHTFEADKIDRKYNYFLQLCHDFNYDQLRLPKSRTSNPRQKELDRMALETAALIQVDTENEFENFKVLGRFNNTRIRGGTDWVRMEFRDGDRYSGECNNSPRTAEVMITCDPSAKYGKLRILHEENTDASGSECYYLLELGSSYVCNAEQKSSAFVVLLKILFWGFVTYLVVGFFYNKFINKNPRIPHSNFFKLQGNKAADLCDKFFRSSVDERYTGLNNDGIINDPNERPGFGRSSPEVVEDQPEINEDDHLLPM